MVSSSISATSQSYSGCLAALLIFRPILSSSSASSPFFFTFTPLSMSA